jgi:WD40 repeat protein/serine/threonine protein kinase
VNKSPILDEGLVQRLPLPLAQLCLRAHNAHTPLERHQGAYYLWEAALKLLACVAVAEYAELGQRDPELAERLKSLARPSLGHWWEFTRRLVPILADAGDPGFAAVRELLLGRARDDMPGAAALDAALTAALGGRGGTRRTVRLTELFDRLVQYRNHEIGHGAAGQRPGSFYDEMSRMILAGVAQVLGRLDVLAGRRLLYVGDVRRQASGSWLVERYALVGESARRIESLELGEDQTTALPHPEQVYVERPTAADAAAAPRLLPLHPLVHFEAGSNLTYFLNAHRGKTGIEYLSYGSGGTLQRGNPAGEHRELLARVLGQPVDATAAQAWANASMAEEPAAGAAAAAPARTIGEFELLSRLGQGGMGVVYRAWQPSLARQVALKCMLRVGDPKAEVRFDREIRALGRVEHPHIVKVFTSGREGDQWFYAMELIEGAEVSQVCEELAGCTAAELDAHRWRSALTTACEHARSRETRLTDDAAEAAAQPAPAPAHAPVARAVPPPGGRGHVTHVVEIVRQVADGVHALHEAGVVHRDIKPGNILLTADTGAPVLMDLGLAQLAEETEGRITTTRQFIGTLRYASPEQVLSAARVDRRTDVYSLGATLWELLTLRPLYDATDATPSPELMQRVLTRRPERPRKLNPRVPPDLETIVLKCLEKDPRQRYATAGELAEDLGRFLRGEPVRAQPPTLGYLLSKSLHKYRWRIGTLAAGVILLILGAVVAFVEVSGARDQAETALAREAEARGQLEVLLSREQQALEELAKRQLQLRHSLAENYLQSGASDCVNHEPGLGLASLLAAYESAPPDDPLRHSIRLLMAGWERGLATRFLHDDSLEAVAFHPSQPLLLTAGRDGFVHFWDLHTHLPSGNPVKPGGKVWAAVFSPRGDLLATGDDERGAILWDLQSRRSHGAPLTHAAPVKALAFSPDGKRLATGCDDGKARLWDVATQTPIGQPLPHKGVVWCVTFSPDGAVLASGGADRYLRFWDANTGKPLGDPIRHGSDVETISYSPDGRYFFTGDWAGQGRLYEAGSRRLVHDHIRHKEAILSSVFTADGRRLLVSSRDDTAQFWDVTRGETIGQSYGALRSVRAVALSPDGEYFITGSRDCVARLFRDARPRPLAAAFSHSQAVQAVAVSPDGRHLATACKDGAARLWDLSGRHRVGKDMPHGAAVVALAFSQDGKLLVTAATDKTLRRWHADTGEPAGEDIRVRDEPLALSLFPDQPWALVGGKDRAAYCIDLAADRRLKEPLRHDLAIQAVAVTPDGKFLLTGSADRTIRLWDRARWLPAGKVMRHDDKILALAVDRTGGLLVSGSADNTARLWNLRDQTYVHDMKGHERNVNAVAISPDGHLVLTGSDDRTTRLWDAATGKPVGEPIEHDSIVRGVAFVADGSRYVVARDSGAVDLWPTPWPVPDEPRRIAAWIRARTLWVREGASHRRLTVEEWKQSLAALAELGGPFPDWDGR